MADFDQQLKLEELERAQREGRDPNIKVDEDGTPMEWDAEKRAWFPKIDEDFIAKYQMNYGVAQPDADDSEKTPTATPSDATGDASIPPMPAVTDPAYEKWYYDNYHKFAQQQGEGATAEDTKAYEDYYNYYYGYSSTSQAEDKDKDPEKGDQSEQDADGETSSDKPNNGDDGSEDISKEESDTKKEEYFKYWKEIYGGKNTDTEEYKQYWQQYYDNMSQAADEEVVIKSEKEIAKEKKAEERAAKEEKKKAKEKEPPAWFEMAEDEKNTNVYVTGLPEEITDPEYEELMKKCGLLMFDPLKRKPKLKLYKDKDGNNKGDGLCCYIKSESVELALQILDGYEYEGHKLHVERAVFELKGKFDPTKRKRKLTNKEKKNFLEKQRKLFDWRPDKLASTRNRWERVLILKNVFDPSDFEDDPTLINKVRQDVREEVNRFGEIRKVTIHDRHPDGVAQVMFAEAEEADLAVAGMQRKFFAGRRLLASTWDGKEKFHIQETEEEEKKRLAEWENYLEGGGDPNMKPSSAKPGDTPTAAPSGDSVPEPQADGKPESPESSESRDTLTTRAASDNQSEDSIEDSGQSQTSPEEAVEEVDRSIEEMMEDSGETTADESGKKTEEEGSKKTLEECMREIAEKHLEDNVEEVMGESVETNTDKSVKKQEEEGVGKTLEECTKEIAEKRLEENVEEVMKENVETNTDESVKKQEEEGVGKTLEKCTKEIAEKRLEENVEEVMEESVETNTDESVKKQEEEGDGKTLEECMKEVTEKRVEENVEENVESDVKSSTEETMDS